MGFSVNGTNYGAAVGRLAYGQNSGAAVGRSANGQNSGAAMGAYPYAGDTNVAVGYRARASGVARTALGPFVTNGVNNSTAVRGNIYLDGCDGNIRYRASFGSGGWSTKAFTIDHPLDPENKVLRHFTVESPDVWNEYSGNAVLKDGTAQIELPDYYSALNLSGSEVCNLTPWGNANVWVEGDVTVNILTIAGDKDVKVSWTVRAKRNDPACRRDLELRPTEQLKTEMPEGQISAENASVNTIVVSSL